jgi:hypothetical protein
MADVRDAAAALSEGLAAAHALIGRRDTEQPAMIRGSDTAESAPPWNTRAADAYTTAHEGVRRLHASMHRQVHGTLPARPGGSDGNTARTLRQIAVLASGIGHHQALPAKGRCGCDSCRASAILTRWTASALLLPAVDTAVHWAPIQGDPPCPYCECLSLRVAERTFVIGCLNPDCEDGDGNRPLARLDYDKRGQANVCWNDGRVTAATGAA